MISPRPVMPGITGGITRTARVPRPYCKCDHSVPGVYSYTRLPLGRLLTTGCSGTPRPSSSRAARRERDLRYISWLLPGSRFNWLITGTSYSDHRRYSMHVLCYAWIYTCFEIYTQPAPCNRPAGTASAGADDLHHEKILWCWRTGPGGARG